MLYLGLSVLQINTLQLLDAKNQSPDENRNSNIILKFYPEEIKILNFIHCNWMLKRKTFSICIRISPGKPINMIACGDGLVRRIQRPKITPANTATMVAVSMKFLRIQRASFICGFFCCCWPTSTGLILLWFSIIARIKKTSNYFFRREAL